MSVRVENNRITHDAYGKDRADAVAAAAWSAVGESLSLTQRLVQETLGDIYNSQQPGQAYSTPGLKW